MTDQRPQPEDLALELKKVARVGVATSNKLVGVVPQLSRLQIVRSEAQSDEPHVLALVVAEVLRRAVEGLEEPDGAAARILLGVDPEMAWRSLTQRRKAAAETLLRNESTFRKTDEINLLRRVADELYRMELASHPVPHAATRSEPGAPAALAKNGQSEVATRSGLTPGTIGRRRPQPRRWLAIGLGVATVISALVVLGVIAAARGSKPAPDVVLQEPFSKRNRGWTDDAVFHYDNGAYVGALPGGSPDGRASRAPISTDRLPPNLRISVAGTKTSDSPGGSFGVFCRDNGGLRYGARIDPESQSYTIYKVEVSGQHERPLVPREISEKIHRSEPNRPVSNTIELKCTGDPAGNAPVTLTVVVNNKEVRSTVDPTGYPSGQAGVEIASESGGVEVRFHDFALLRAQ